MKQYGREFARPPHASRKSKQHTATTHQCPQCGLEGRAHLFKIGWVASLEMEMGKADGTGIPQNLALYSWEEKRRLLNFLRRQR